MYNVMSPFISDSNIQSKDKNETEKKWKTR